MYIRSSKRDEDQSKLIEEGDQAPSSEKVGGGLQGFKSVGEGRKNCKTVSSSLLHRTISCMWSQPGSLDALQEMSPYRSCRMRGSLWKII
jgi:hypothetical protein